MSAPRTNMQTQKRRHRGPLVGMALVVLFGVTLIIYWLFEEAAPSEIQAGDDQPAGETAPLTDGAVAPVESTIPDAGSQAQ